MYRKILTYEVVYLLSYEENIQSAIELRNARVSFCKNITNSFRDIHFNGSLPYLPQLEINEH
ncbi:hypothetical protein IEQ34_020330 [Dendrobium chrysotoxum]|uniref:Uncharacterized protein n=1 Tax=Dendrobium chrysotoxum TaxID=161865 RepID=A0AAV7G1L8_DENCH|nr:hypothetical protein IEQ34_020330 [Dendrobium chrysotoxum]